MTCIKQIAIAVALGAWILASGSAYGKPDKSEKNDPNAVRLTPEERIREHVRQVLELNDSEWQVIGPKIDRIQALLRESTSKSGGTKTKDKSDRPEGSKDKSGRDPSERKDKSAKLAAAEAKAAAKQDQGDKPVSLVGLGYTELRAVASDKEAQVTDMKEALQDYRMAKAMARDELAKARDELRELVTVRQEVQLVLLGILD